MVTKECVMCGSPFEAKGSMKFCSNECKRTKKILYLREYNKRPEVRERDRQRIRVRENLQRPEVKERQKEYDKKFNQRPEVKARKKEKRQSPEFRALEREWAKKYRSTPHGRAKRQIIWQKRRAHHNKVIHKFTEKEWKEKLKSCEGVCVVCKVYVGETKLSLDHIYPISKAKPGRVYFIQDIQAVCRPCNARKGNRLE